MNARLGEAEARKSGCIRFMLFRLTAGVAPSEKSLKFRPALRGIRQGWTFRFGGFQRAVSAPGLAPLFCGLMGFAMAVDGIRLLAPMVLDAGLDACIGRKIFLLMNRDPALV
jgi:hypothetical protein